MARSRTSDVWARISARGGPLALTGAGLVLAGLLWWLVVSDISPPSERPLELPWWVLAPVFLVAEAVTFEIRYSDRHGKKVSFSETALVVALFFGTSPGEVLFAAALASASIYWFKNRLPFIKFAFNVVTVIVEVLLAFAVFDWINPDWTVRGGRAWAAAFVTAFVASLFSHLSVAAVVCAAEGRWRLQPFIRPDALTTVNTAASTSLGIVSAVLLLENPVLVVFLVAPLGLMLLLHQQITRGLAAERRSKESEALLQAIVDNSSAVIYVKDMHGRYRLVNKQWERVAGRSREHIVGKTAADVFDPELTEQFASTERLVYETREPVSVEEQVREDGGMRRYLSIKFPLLDASGAMYSLCGISTDITAAKQLEDRLQKAQKMEAIGQLAGGVAHDFNNLLAVIHNYAQFVAEDLPADASTREDIAQVLRASKAAANLTRQLLAFSRRDVVNPKVLDVNQVVETTHGMLRRTIPETIELRKELYAAPLYAEFDEGQLEQVLMNLVVNARDAMPGGGTITIETSAGSIPSDYGNAPEHLPAGSYVLLSVRDTGMGMSETVMGHIFEPFFTTKDRRTGTGLGLATVYGIVEQCGGSIQVDSTVGRGTCFSIYLPAVKPQQKPADDAAPREAAPPQGTILLAEDSDGVRAVATRILERSGYRVIAASSGAHAVELWHRHRGEIDLLLTDVVMPQMSGKEVSELTGLPTLFMSGYTDQIIGRQEMREDRFIQKPFTQGELLEKVSALLSTQAIRDRRG